MMLAVAILTGLALGYLVPTDGPRRGLGVARTLAALVLVVAAAMAWPRISPDASLPALAFGGAVLAGVIVAVGIERAKDARALAAEEALLSQ